MSDRCLPKSRWNDLLSLLRDEGYEVIGPRIEQEAIVYAPIRSAAELPIGWTADQSPGSYRLGRRGDDAWFGFAVGPHSWKKYLFPPERTLWRANRDGDGYSVTSDAPTPPKRAFLGMRACELHALAVQDRVFLDRDGRYTDPHYAAVREEAFLIAVECQHPGGTCFCASMGTGPDVRMERLPKLADRPKPHSDDPRVPLPMTGPPSEPIGCDIVLTELEDSFVVREASERGRKLLDRLDLAAASPDQVASGRERVAAAATRMGRSLNVEGIRDLLHGNQEHPRWDDVAGRCVACANCTLVCPTCFCSSTDDQSDLSGTSAERVRRWDSCFNPEFGRVHGGNFRPSIRGRYRQWLTHKFASWFDQFDLSGCVGCGRCITWCPVGIDVTEEIAAIRPPRPDQEGATT